MLGFSTTALYTQSLPSSYFHVSATDQVLLEPIVRLKIGRVFLI